MEMKPYQSNALYPNKLGLGRIRVTQPRVRAKRGKRQNTPRIEESVRELCEKGSHPHLTS